MNIKAAIKLILKSLAFSVCAGVALCTDNFNSAGSEAMDDLYRTVSIRNWKGCSGFSQREAYGSWAKVIGKELSNQKRYSNLLEGTSDLQQTCPQYQSMSYESRFNVWVMILMTMAYYESSCGSTALAQAPNGTASGLLQLHLGYESGYSGGCRKGDSRTPEGSIRCALSMLDDQLARDGKLFSEKSYWEVLRPRGRSQKAYLIRASVRGFTPCQVPR